MFNYAHAAVYEKWMNDLGDEQRASGELPGIVPTSRLGIQVGQRPRLGQRVTCSFPCTSISIAATRRCWPTTTTR